MQNYWTPEEVDRRVETGEPISASDRVEVGDSNMSVRSYLFGKKSESIQVIRHAHNVSYDEAREIFRKGPIGRVLYG